MSSLEETWKVWVRRFWWLRGVTTALALTALAPTFIDLSRYEFLRAFHAVIVGWNLATEKLGEIIGEIPFIPQISSAVVSSLIIFISIGLPMFISFINQFVISYIKGINKILCLSCFFSAFLAPILITYGYYLIITVGLDFVRLILTAILVLLGLFVAILKLPGYGKGLIFVTSFIIAMEILYLLNTPWIAQQISQFACEALEAPPENCLPSSEGS